MSNWKYYEDVDFSNQEIAIYNIDTRDFYCSAQPKEGLKREPLDTRTIDKYPQSKYYHTEQEVKDLLKRFWTESGGDGEWRYLYLETNHPQVLNWNLKYIRIFRTDKGFLVCNDDCYILSKSVLSSPVGKEYLNFIESRK